MKQKLELNLYRQEKIEPGLRQNGTSQGGQPTGITWGSKCQRQRHGPRMDKEKVWTLAFQWKACNQITIDLIKQIMVLNKPEG